MVIGIEAGDGGEDGFRLPRGSDGVGTDVAVAGGAGRIGDPADVGLTAAVIDMTGGAGTDLRRHLPWAVRGQRVALLALRRMGRAPGEDLLLPATLADRREGDVTRLAVVLPGGMRRHDGPWGDLVGLVSEGPARPTERGHEGEEHQPPPPPEERRGAGVVQPVDPGGVPAGGLRGGRR